MLQSAESFIESESDRLWDRNELITNLKDIFSKKGRFVCVVGGKNTGKSLLAFEEIKSRYKEKVFKVDLRADPSILNSLS